MLKPHTRSRMILLLFMMLALLTIFLSSLPVHTSRAASGCQVIYTPHPWDTGLTADVKIVNNNTAAISGWTLTWSFANGQQSTGSWNATVTQSGANVTASNPAGHWNGTIAPNGGSASFGFQATHTGTNDIPTNFALNGVACGDTTATDTPTPITETPGYGYFPDLTIVSVTFNYGAENGCVMPGKRGFSAVVANTGIADAAAFVVSLNGAVLTVPGLAVGTQTTIFFEGVNTTNAQGIAIADSTNAIGELYEGNNQLTFPTPMVTDLPSCTPTPTPGTPTPITPTLEVGPDLIVNWISTSPKGIYICGEPLYLQLSVAIRNQGTVDAGSFEVDLNGQYRVTVPGVAAGAYAVANFPDYSYTSNTATVDVTNAVAETDENNNSKTQTMLGLPTPPPCTIALEAESAALSGGARVAFDHTGYTGSGFVAGYYGASTRQTTTFTVNVYTTGVYKTLLRYANAMGSAQRISIYVNGVHYADASYPNLVNWDTWADSASYLSLRAGTNTIAFRKDSGDGVINLDHLYMPPGTTATSQAEIAALSGGARVATDHTGFSGTGFVTGYCDAGTGQTTTFDVGANGGANLVLLRYANGTGSAQRLSIYVNGVHAADVSYPRLANWDTWADSLITLNLGGGANTISVRKDSGDGCINLDYLIVLGKP